MNKDVYGCFNANIIRLFKESKEPNLSFYGECIVNMSNGSATYDEQIKEVVQYAKEIYNIDAEELSKELCSRKTRLHNRRVSFNFFKKGMNGYISAKQKVQEDIDFIMKYKWRLTKFDKDLYSEFLPQEMCNGPETQQKVKDYNRLSTGEFIAILIVGGLFGVLIAWAGPLILLFALFVGALLLKCWR